MSPGGNRYYIPSCVGSICIPYTNQIFETLDKGYPFYKEYDRLGGFNIRKTTEKRAVDGTITLKHYVCSNEGFNDASVRILKESAGKERKTVSQRCGCKAKMVVKYMSGNVYVVSTFVKEHNHELAGEIGRQFLRVSRQMDISLRNFVFACGKVNIGCNKSFSLAKELVGSYSNVGATLRDFRNFDQDLKEFVGERDGQMMIDKFKVMKETSDSFYYAYEVDSGGHLTKLFWCDAVGRRNFELYGDAVSFDATFDTNKYNMIFAPIHWC